MLFALKDPDRSRVLAGIWRRGPHYRVRRIAVITLSLALLVAVPELGLARVDLWAGRHVLLGAPADFVSALKGVVVAIAVLWGTTFTVNVFVGRFFCGWGCPVGYTSRLGEEVDLVAKSRRRWLLAHLAGAGFVGTFVASVMLWWVDPRVMVEGSWTARLATLGVFLALSLGGYLHAFVWRYLFCLDVCPIGLYYRYVTSRAPVGISFLEVPDPCIQCGACEKVCPVDLDPKRLGELLPPRAADAGGEPRYGDAECLRCGDCVEACGMIFAAKPGKRPPLQFGRTTTAGPAGAAARSPARARDDAPPAAPPAPRE